MILENNVAAVDPLAVDRARLALQMQQMHWPPLDDGHIEALTSVDAAGLLKLALAMVDQLDDDIEKMYQRSKAAVAVAGVKAAGSV